MPVGPTINKSTILGTAEISPEARRLIIRHLRFGWGSLLVFLTLGIVLEAMHGFKVGWYLNPSNETRRLLWTLAHAHGTLLGLIHIALAATLPMIVSVERIAAIASPCLMGSSVLLPGGFFLGGWFIFESDPGLGTLLTPAGAVLLMISVFVVFRSISAARGNK